jgi:Spy/CpxP family protein refolding chaperone
MRVNTQIGGNIMITRTFTIALVIAALVIGAVGFSFASDQATKRCCSYIKAVDCQFMQGLTPEQRFEFQRDLQKRIEPAGPENYPSGLQYDTGA